MKTQTEQTDGPPEGNFPFVLIQGLDGTYKIYAGLAAEEAKAKDERGMLEGAILGGGGIRISNDDKAVYTIPFENTDNIAHLQIGRIMDDYASQVGYTSWVYAGR